MARYGPTCYIVAHSVRTVSLPLQPRTVQWNQFAKEPRSHRSFVVRSQGTSSRRPLALTATSPSSSNAVFAVGGCSNANAAASRQDTIAAGYGPTNLLAVRFVRMP